MTNPFTAFAFAATGASTNRTMPDRLAEIHNVKDFGAVGNGIADDHAAIMAAINWQTGDNIRGTIYFPPGTYYVSEPIDFSAPSDIDTGPLVGFKGEFGLSIIIGNFVDYVLKRGIDSTPRWDSTSWGIDGLTIINQAAGGGGIRFGAVQGGVISDCDVTADIGINDDNTDEVIDGGNINGSFEVLIENCNLRPTNTRAAGSFGIIKMSDGPVTNCRMIGFDVGMGTGSGQGGATVQGCYFEANNIGFSPSTVIEVPGRQNGGGGNVTLRGCYFKNNGIGINKGGGGCTYQGVRIDAATGTIPGNPQYGIKTTSDSMAGRMEGITVAGTYAVAGVYVTGGESTRHFGTMTGIGSVSWTLPSTAMTVGYYKACNVAPVWTLSQLPAFRVTVTAGSWAINSINVLSGIINHGASYIDGFYSNVALTGGTGTGAIANILVSSGVVNGCDLVSGGQNYVAGDTLSVNAASVGGTGSGFTINVTTASNTATLDFSSPVDVSNLATRAAAMIITGVTPSGYNATVDGWITSGSRLTYPLASNPGSYTSGGSVFFNAEGNAYEGETYNLSDANLATWGDPVTSTGANHVKVRYSGAGWSVMGK